MTSARISLPWPNKALSPNTRVHWRALAAFKKEARHDAYWTVLASTAPSQRKKLAVGDGPILLAVTFVPPDNRARDLDNCVASAKASFDGLADALKVNDKRFKPSFQMGSAQSPGHIEIVIGETGE